MSRGIKRCLRSGIASVERQDGSPRVSAPRVSAPRGKRAGSRLRDRRFENTVRQIHFQANLRACGNVAEGRVLEVCFQLISLAISSVGRESP